MEQEQGRTRTTTDSRCPTGTASRGLRGTLAGQSPKSSLSCTCCYFRTSEGCIFPGDHFVVNRTRDTRAAVRQGIFVIVRHNRATTSIVLDAIHGAATLPVAGIDLIINIRELGDCLLDEDLPAASRQSPHFPQYPVAAVAIRAAKLSATPP
jgi:hypothetical protein